MPSRGGLAVVGRDGAEVLLDPGERLLRVDVADDRQDRVVGRVVGAEERARVLQRRRVQVGHRADGRVVVRVALGVGQRGQPLEGGAVGHVVVALPALVLDHVTLVVQRLLVERGQQRAHPVRLQPERQLQLVGGHGLEVVGALEARRAVERAAGALDQLEVAVALDLAEPWNIRCSNRWARPVRPSTSCREPTSYQRQTAATGVRWSSESTRRRPLSRRCSVAVRPPEPACSVAV